MENHGPYRQSNRTTVRLSVLPFLTEDSRAMRCLHGRLPIIDLMPMIVATPRVSRGICFPPPGSVYRAFFEFEKTPRHRSQFCGCR